MRVRLLGSGAGTGFPAWNDGAAVATVDDAVKRARLWGCEELVVSGGAQVYAAALPVVDLVVLTVVQAEVEGAATFPDFQSQGPWACERREFHPADAENAHDLEFQWWRRGADQSS